MPRFLFVGDVHLRPGDAAFNAPFLRFLETQRERGLDALIIVGDLFDYWIGPKHLEGDDYREALEALRGLTRAGVRIEFLHGNRDYFVEERFARATGVRVAGRDLRISLGGREVWCTHGDFVYNRNPKYAAYRAVMRFKPLRAAYLAMPACVGKGIARGFRKVSPRTTPQVRWTREELVEGARPLFERGADVLICGHIHWPSHIECAHGSRRREIFVLGDWCGGTRDYVEWDGVDLRLLRPRGTEVPEKEESTPEDSEDAEKR
ncbi:MAG: UDP-2,3-diacylglucosamine diphosphatase [Planctomycetes bacterium]|nr:UDP-2,3-diacylglucosamine diphosphatase [Planctomycetota bacterium]